MPRSGKNIYQRRDGRFEGRYIKGRKENGKPEYGYIYGATYKEAENKLALAQAGHAALPAPGVLTVSQWLNKWLDTAAAFISTQAHGRYTSVISAHLSPELGDCRLLAVDGEAINRFIRESGLPKSTQMDIVSMMRSAMKLAEIEYGITGVADAIAAVTWEKSMERTLTPMERERLTASSRHRGDTLDAGILLALYLGMRGGELCALRWRDIDLETGVIRISKSVRRVRFPDENSGTKTRVILGEPEFKSAIREVPLPMFLIEFFTEQSCFHLPADYILNGRSDKVIEPRSAEYHLLKRMDEVGLEGVSFRTLRDTFESGCMAAGFSLQVINALLGRKIPSRDSAALPFPSLEQKRESIEKLAKDWTFRD